MQVNAGGTWIRSTGLTMPSAMSNFPFAPVIGALLAAGCLSLALRAARRKRLVDNLPTSKTTGVFMGLVELKGTAEAETPLCSFLAEVPCVYHAWQVEEHWSRTVTETYTDSKGNVCTRTRSESGWNTVAEGGDRIAFYLQDDCGVIRVQPEGAEMQADTVFSRTCGRGAPLYYAKGPALAVGDSDHERRFLERAVPLHAALYVMGQAREREDIVAPEIARDTRAPIFLISTKSEQEVSSGQAWSHWGLGVLGLVIAMAGLFVQQHQKRGVGAEDWQPLLLAGAVFLVAWFLGWLWMAFNSMVELRQRVRQAWANVDVQLTRRCDLIPRLVEIVRGLRNYERNVQTELARLRAELTATAPGEPGPEPAACSAAVTAIAESYPELKASGTFQALMRELTQTEDRIALARSYFNDIAMFYNTRLETIPDRYISALGAMKPQPVMAADQFVHQPVVLNLAK